MKRLSSALIVLSLLICAPASAQIKPCDELKDEIDAKLQAKGVVNYTLEIVSAGEVTDQEVVGSCDGGKNRITYSKEEPKREGPEGEN
ncbi:MAG: DUF1161 domain-containing protein [bacterium]